MHVKVKPQRNQSNFLTLVIFVWRTMFLQWNISCWLAANSQNQENTQFGFLHSWNDLIQIPCDTISASICRNRTILTLHGKNSLIESTTNLSPPMAILPIAFYHSLHVCLTPQVENLSHLSTISHFTKISPRHLKIFTNQ